jgi:spore coat polysaccharide biosynthesis protein SpsF
MTSRVVAIVQARMGSSRLPGKVLLDIGGQAMLARVVVRAARSRAVQELIVATTTDPSDDQLAQYCRARRINCTRGSQFDVLDRYFQAATGAKADIIVRITADCPVIDPGLVEDAVDALNGESGVTTGAAHSNLLAPFDFATNRLPPPWRRTYPIGLDTEVCTFGALERAWKEAREPQEREHVMPYFYEGVELSTRSPQLSTGVSPRGFSMALLNYKVDLGAYRWTVDTYEDLEFMRRVYSEFDGRDDFSWKDVLELVVTQPELMQINARVKHKSLGDLDDRGLGK